MTHDVTFADLQTQSLAVVDLEADGPESIPGLFGPAFDEVAHVTARQGLTLTGPPIAHYHPSTESWRISVGFPVMGSLESEGRVHAETHLGGRVALTVHTGSYDGLVDACAEVRDAALDNGYECDDDWWERYLDDPAAVMPRTEILVGCRRVRAHGPAPAQQPSVTLG